MGTGVEGRELVASGRMCVGWGSVEVLEGTRGTSVGMNGVQGATSGVVPSWRLVGGSNAFVSDAEPSVCTCVLQ